MRSPLSSALAIGLALMVSGLACGQPAAHVWTAVGSPPDAGSSPPRTLERSELRIHVGDVAGAERPEFDDSAWRTARFLDAPSGTGIFWVRCRWRIDAPEAMPPGFEITTPAAYEAFWDGEPVLRSGAPGRTREAEVPGLMFNYGSIPAARRGAGEHVLALRMSSFRAGYAQTGLGLALLDPVARRAAMQRNALFPAVAAGACLILAAAAGLMWLFGPRRLALLWLASFAACMAVTQLLAVGRGFAFYHSDWYHVVTSLRVAAGVLAGTTLVGFVIEQFAVPHRRWIFAALLPLYAVALAWKPPLTSIQDRFFLAGCAALALALAVRAAWQRRGGAWLLAGGLSITTGLLASDPTRYASRDFIRAFFPTAAGMFAVFAFELHAERQRARETQLTGARMEIELLKKNLQPHFLMNTLTALSEVVEQSPREAVRLIDDLAEEFRTVARVSAEKLIPLAQELDLCRAHLRVMSVRTGRAWRLDAAGVDGAAAFTLRSERGADGATRYTFLSPGAVQTDSTRPAGGTGLRYVKARLEESFPGRWSLRGEPVADGWQTTIEVVSAGKGGLA